MKKKLITIVLVVMGVFGLSNENVQDKVVAGFSTTRGFTTLPTNRQLQIDGTITSGTAGSVLFIGSGPVLSQDNSNFFWDDTDNELGLQTTNPNAVLHIRGDSTTLFKVASGSTNFSILEKGFVGVGVASPSTKFEVQGTASASYLLTGNTLQVGGYASVAYSRFGTATTTHTTYMTAANDVLVSGDLEVKASVSILGVASASSDLYLSGIQTLSGAGNALCLNGSKVVQDDSPVTACSGASSILVKEQVESLHQAQNLQDILKMRPVSYRFKKSYKPNDQTTHLGLIAEEVAEIDKLLIEKDGNLQGVKYVEIVPKLIAAIQEQQKQIDELRNNPRVVEGGFWGKIWEFVKSLIK